MHLELVFEWMPPQLFRNKERTQHWGVRQYHSKTSRMVAAAVTREVITSSKEKINFQPKKDIPISVYFYPPDKRRRDVDGMFSALKPTLDGIADAIEVDDQYFNPTHLYRCAPVKGGKVKIIVG